MLWMAPGPWMSATTYVAPAATSFDGETFQPRPRSRAGPAPVPSVAMPPRPFSPVGFSGLIDRVRAVDSRARLPRPRPNPLKPADGPASGWAPARQDRSPPNQSSRTAPTNQAGPLANRRARSQMTRPFIVAPLPTVPD